MNVQIQYQEPSAAILQNALEGAGKFSSFIGGVYGYVREINMLASSVKVELMNGGMLHSVRVPSRSWIDETASTVTGTVDLPPVNTLVFVMLPYGMKNTSGAVVLFSVFDDENKKHATRLVEGEEKKAVTVLGGNIRTTYDRATGNYLVEDVDDAKLKISLNKADKTIEVFDWNDNKITLSAAGVLMEGAGNTLSLEAGKVLVNGHLEVLQ